MGLTSWCPQSVRRRLPASWVGQDRFVALPLEETDAQRESRKQRSRCKRRALIICATVVVLVILYKLYLRTWNPELVTVRMTACMGAVLAKHGIDYAITDGYLLGLVRDGGMIPWDKEQDIDLIIKSTDEQSILELIPVIQNSCDVYMTHRSFYENYPVHWTPFIIEKTCFRIYPNRFTPYYVDVQDFYVAQSSTDPNKKVLQNLAYADAYGAVVELDYDLVFPAEECPIRPFGFSVKCPRDVNYVLTTLYGSDWRVPKQGYKTKDSIAEGDGGH